MVKPVRRNPIPIWIPFSTRLDTFGSTGRRCPWPPCCWPAGDGHDRRLHPGPDGPLSRPQALPAGRKTTCQIARTLPSPAATTPSSTAAETSTGRTWNSTSALRQWSTRWRRRKMKLVRPDPLPGAAPCRDLLLRPQAVSGRGHPLQQVGRELLRDGESGLLDHRDPVHTRDCESSGLQAKRQIPGVQNPTGLVTGPAA